MVTIIKEKATRRPLSVAQLGIWFAQQLAPKSPIYNIGEYFEIQGTIDPTLFETALRRIVAEAEVLHITFVDDSDPPSRSLILRSTGRSQLSMSVERQILA